MADSTDILTRYMAAINAHDAGAIQELISPDSRLVDATGVEIMGATALNDAWQAYFAMIPDYCIRPERYLTSPGGWVAVFGRAGGSYAMGGVLVPDSEWQIPFAALARLQNERVAEWRIFCDNEPLRRIMGFTSGEASS